MSLGRLKNSLGAVIFITISVLVYSFKDTIVGCVTGLPSFVAVFALSFIGASSVIMPVPYTAIIFVLASKGLDPLVMAIAGGVGSGLASPLVRSWAGMVKHPRSLDSSIILRVL
jgi:hypothetical protein